MAGWSREKRSATEKAFYQFLGKAHIFSKEKGRICVGEHLLEGQRRVITQIFDALENDVHEVAILKSRQLGISTIIRLLTTFLIGLNPGMQGAIVFDVDDNKIKARTELETVIAELPAKLKFPGILKNNRQSIILNQKAEILFKSAGVTKGKSSGGLGRSVGLSFLHASELCMWGDPGGLEALKNSLAQTNPDRLFIYESTAKGYNLWFDLWQEMRNDPIHCKTIFIGWWAHDDQRIERAHADFAAYGTAPPTEQEQKKIAKVKKLYDVDITPEQLAWVRRKYDPTAKYDEVGKGEATSERIQEQPWDEDEAFRTSGSIFFSSEKLTDQSQKHVAKPRGTYAFLAGEEFVHMRVTAAENSNSLELKVWEEPAQDSYYAIGIDPAFGENPGNDRSSIQVLRCYADGCDQVAEYAFSMINTRQLAWVAAAICGWYGFHPRNEVRYILELNGPGTAVWNELRSLRQQIDTGYPPLAQEEGLKNVFRNVQSYTRTREDSLGPGMNWHIKTNPQSKVADMEALRDYVSNGQLHIRSKALIDEMQTITREESKLGAPAGKKDDRVLAAAFAVRCWLHRMRPALVRQKMTREAVRARTELRITDQVSLFHSNQLESYFKDRAMTRYMAAAKLQRRSLWGRR